MSDSGSGSEVEEEYEVEAIINDRSEGNERRIPLYFTQNHLSLEYFFFIFSIL